jgi:phosphohistidine swiveling domain-containing protein
MNDEIVVLRKIDRNMLLTLKKAKGIILEEEPDPEITDLLKSFGIPTVVRKKGRLLYSTGDVVSLNATTGEIKRGNMLVS